ncbi:MAG TPA: helix-turn-helix transcriptional regulator [Phycisphaerae bacterium]|nr:helix-turn-helix transcriptional regulator [Phycisphaerae bacterium]
MNLLIPIALFEDLSKSGRLGQILSRLADLIAKARKAAGLTQAELAARLKLPQSQISRIERNPDRTTIRTLKRIAKSLGVDVSALVS